MKREKFHVCCHCGGTIRYKEKHESTCVENPVNTRGFVLFVVDSIKNKQIKNLNKAKVKEWLNDNLGVKISNVERHKDMKWSEWVKYICSLECQRILENEEHDAAHIIETISFWFNDDIDIDPSVCNFIFDRVLELAIHDARTHFLTLEFHKEVNLKYHIDAVLFLHDLGEIEVSDTGVIEPPLVYKTIQEYKQAAITYDIYDEDGLLR